MISTGLVLQFLQEVNEPIFITDSVGNILFSNTATQKVVDDHAIDGPTSLIDTLKEFAQYTTPASCSYSHGDLNYAISLTSVVQDGAEHFMSIWRRNESLSVKDVTLANKVFESSNDGIVVCGGDFTINKANPALNEVLYHLGFDCETVIGKAFFDVFGHIVDRVEIEKSILQNGSWVHESRFVEGDESFIWVFMVSQIRNNDETDYLIMISDVTETHNAVETMERLSLTENSKGEYPKQLFIEKTNGVIDTKKACSMIFLDIDRFKQVNNSLGHAAGDKILQVIYDRICVEVGDSGVAIRFGADSFLIAILAGDTRATSYNISLNIMESIKRPIPMALHDLSLNCSIGISHYGDHGENAESLIKNAEAAMRSVKINGRNKIAVYEPDMNAHDIQKLYLEASLRQAMIKGDLVLFYQPQVGQDGKISGMEALVRWSRQGEITSPAEFIHIAEESGMINQIGVWALEESCRQICEWERQGVPLVPVAVNISASHFMQDGFAEQVVGIIQRYNVDPVHLNIEITETSLLNNSDAVTATINKLNEAGIRIAIDDFGTGYSSLSYLHRFKLDKIKIDQVFIRGAMGNKTDMAIVLAIIGIAKSMDVQIIAEGVESEDLAKSLYEYGCNSIQGYVYSKPVPASQIPALMLKSF